MRSDAFGCIRMRSDALGRARKILKMLVQKMVKIGILEGMASASAIGRFLEATCRGHMWGVGGSHLLNNIKW